MKRAVVAVVVLFACTLLFAASVPAQDATTFDVVVTKVRLAAVMLEERGDLGLSEFNDPEGTWAWADTYVFVIDCDTGEVLAHPNNELIGEDIYNLKDAYGNSLGGLFCSVTYAEKGRWVEYWRLTDAADDTGSGEAYKRKISYIYKVPGHRYVLGAGIYEPSLTLKELNEKVDNFSQ
jgi:hypothetical protein